VGGAIGGVVTLGIMIGIIVLMWKCLHARNSRNKSSILGSSELLNEGKKAHILEIIGDDGSNELDATKSLPEMAGSEIRHEMDCSSGQP
jgi:hypothetical protein